LIREAGEQDRESKTHPSKPRVGHPRFITPWAIPEVVSSARKREIKKLPKKKPTRHDMNQAAARIAKQATEKS
jgi:hypothetical protein